MQNVTLDLNTDGERTWLSLTAQLSDEELSRVNGPAERMLCNDSDGNAWLMNCPLALLLETM